MGATRPSEKQIIWRPEFRNDIGMGRRICQNISSILFFGAPSAKNAEKKLDSQEKIDARNVPVLRTMVGDRNSTFFSRKPFRSGGSNRDNFGHKKLGLCVFSWLFPDHTREL